MSKTGMQQGMQQNMAATAAVQMFMRALQANTTELSELAAQAIASNPVLEEAPRRESESPASPDYGKTERHSLFLESLTGQPTLAEHLEEQVRRSALPPATEAAALALIPYLNHHGFFAESPAAVARELGLDEKLFRRALRALQELEPAGVGAADLRESLILQLRRLGELGGIPMLLLQNHWEALVHHRYADAAKALDVEEEAVSIAARRIARLNPDPGSGFSRAELNVISPDVVVSEENGELNVTLSGDGIPQLTLSADYREMLSERAENAELRRYLSRCFREGRELIRAIADRQQTILTVAQAIVARQEAFFRRGPAHQVPLKMETIAADTGVSVSTISRAVRGKYLKCRFGVYELRSFFSSALEGDVSAAVVQNRIRELVAEEDAAHPLSDAALEAALKKEGISAARRTIAKYREQLKILPAALRRKK